MNNIDWKGTIKEILHNGRAMAGILVGVVLLILILFLALFRVNTVVVVGSTHYTDREIKDYAMENPLTSNSVLAMLFCRHIEAEEIPFLESFDLERLNAHAIRIHVNEKKIVGYIVQDTEKMYFDKDGLVVEAVTMDEEELKALDDEKEELKALKEDADRQEALKSAEEAEMALTGEVKKEEEDQGDTEDGIQEPTVLQAEEVREGNESATEFHAAVTDVPRIVGLNIGRVQKDDKIELEDEGIFNTILGITRMVEKYGILPEIVYFDENKDITLVYNNGTIHCQLGADTLLEEKITRVAAILPKLTGQVGILHLEDYTTDTVNIIFKKTTEYELKSKIAEGEGIGDSDGNSDGDTNGNANGDFGGDSAGEPMTDPAADPSAEPSTDPTAEPTVDPAAEPTTDPAIDPAAGQETGAVTDPNTPAEPAQ